MKALLIGLLLAGCGGAEFHLESGQYTQTVTAVSADTCGYTQLVGHQDHVTLTVTDRTIDVRFPSGYGYTLDRDGDHVHASVEEPPPSACDVHRVDAMDGHVVADGDIRVEDGYTQFAVQFCDAYPNCNSRVTFELVREKP